MTSSINTVKHELEADPVCGMRVDFNSKLRTEFQGKDYFFCSEHCRKDFLAGPEKYTKLTAVAPSDAPQVTLKTYFPLLLILAYLLGGIGLSEMETHAWNATRMMTHFMGGFFAIFSFFKLLNLRGFVDAYKTYDVIARKIPAYGWFYPFIELGLGVAFFAGKYLGLVNGVTIVVMAVSSVGVIRSLLKKSKIECACLGTVFKLPMTKVTLFEDLLMIGMAAVSLAVGR